MVVLRRVRGVLGRVGRLYHTAIERFATILRTSMVHSSCRSYWHAMSDDEVECVV